MENSRKDRDIKVISKQYKKNYNVSEPNHQTTRFFPEKKIRNRNNSS